MAVTDHWLIDKSAFVRLHQCADPDLWLRRMDRGLISVTTVTLLELGFSARSGSDWRRGILGPPVTNLLTQLTTSAMEARAIEIQGLLAERGHHRAAKIPDLLIAAIAELAGKTVLHLDKDFELIADVTGQPIERLEGDF